MKAKLKKFKTNYDLFVVNEDNQIKTFASTDNTFVYKLSKQNCDEIFWGLYDTEIDVEIEMECPQCQEWGYVSECRKDCNKKFLQPKLDSEGNLILKKK
jgi:hypothetical protein